jgi:hypothetical protein
MTLTQNVFKDGRDRTDLHRLVLLSHQQAQTVLDIVLEKGMNYTKPNHEGDPGDTICSFGTYEALQPHLPADTVKSVATQVEASNRKFGSVLVLPGRTA